MNENRTVSAELHCLGNLMKRRGEKSHSCLCHQSAQITDMQTRIIGFLYDHRSEDIFQKNIEQAFSMRRPSVSVLIQEMEAKQLVVRESVPYDARLKKVALTEKSLCLAKDTGRKLHRLEKMLTEGIPEEDLAVFFRVTAKIRENLEQRLNESDRKEGGETGK